MSIENQVQLLEKTYQLHQSLLEISKQKEQLIKDNNIDGMRQVLMDERKHVKAIQPLEEKRVITTSGGRANDPASDRPFAKQRRKRTASSDL